MIGQAEARCRRALTSGALQHAEEEEAGRAAHAPTPPAHKVALDRGGARLRLARRGYHGLGRMWGAREGPPGRQKSWARLSS